MAGLNGGNWFMAKSQENAMREKVLWWLNVGKKSFPLFGIKVFVIETYLTFGLRDFWCCLLNQAKSLSWAILLLISVIFHRPLITFFNCKFLKLMTYKYISVKRKTCQTKKSPYPNSVYFRGYYRLFFRKVSSLADENKPKFIS